MVVLFDVTLAGDVALLVEFLAPFFFFPMDCLKVLIGFVLLQMALAKSTGVAFRSRSATDEFRALRLDGDVSGHDQVSERLFFAVGRISHSRCRHMITDKAILWG